MASSDAFALLGVCVFIGAWLGVRVLELLALRRAADLLERIADAVEAIVDR